jgi:hypothetical protein
LKRSFEVRSSILKSRRPLKQHFHFTSGDAKTTKNSRQNLAILVSLFSTLDLNQHRDTMETSTGFDIKKCLPILAGFLFSPCRLERLFVIGRFAFRESIGEVRRYPALVEQHLGVNVIKLFSSPPCTKYNLVCPRLFFQPGLIYVSKNVKYP